MEQRTRDTQRKGYILMRRIYDFTMAMLIVALAMVLFLGDYWKIERIMELDKVFRYLLAWVSVLYGGFRVYRAIKADY